MGAAVGQVPEYCTTITGWVTAVSSLPVIVKLTPNVTDIRPPARAAVAGNADAVYKARHPVFEAVKQAMAGSQAGGANGGAAVQVRGIVESDAAPVARYEPGNPLANAEGYVYAPNVNVVEEMVDMISASRSYQNNVEVMDTAKTMMMATLRLGQS